ncbi:hypothetical protein DMENIID0001_093050 [Sergentomyia squamirostris]
MTCQEGSVIVDHPAGMLDRDQRTAEWWKCCCQESGQRSKPLRDCESCSTTTDDCSASSCGKFLPAGRPVSRTRLRPLSLVRHPRKFCGKVKDLYVVFIFVWISLNCLVQVASKPIRTRRAMIGVSKHTNCHDRAPKDGEDSPDSLVDFNVVKSLVSAHKTQVELAYNEVDQGIFRYVTQVFHQADNLEDFHNTWSWKNIDWLHGDQKMPKQFLQNVPDEYKMSLCERDWSKTDTLLNEFSFMHDKYKRLDKAIGSIMNYYKNNATIQNQLQIIDFIQRLKETSSEIINSITPILTALNYDHATFEASNSHPVPDNYVTKDKPDLENWVILREYMNALELYRVELSIIYKQMPGTDDNSP